MPSLTPRDRTPLQADALIRALSRHQVDWVLCGSYVLKMHGADLCPNDLDVVPDLSPENLQRLATCLASLAPVAAYFENWDDPRNTPAHCIARRLAPATPEALDWLWVTEWGMLDIVIEHADPYTILMSDATHHIIDGIPFHACRPERVLRALETRNRKKDLTREAEYDRLRRQFGLAVKT